VVHIVTTEFKRVKSRNNFIFISILPEGINGVELEITFKEFEQRQTKGSRVSVWKNTLSFRTPKCVFFLYLKQLDFGSGEALRNYRK
jgi:hypothetical protein